MIDDDDDNDGVIDLLDMLPRNALQAGDIDEDGIDSMVDNCLQLVNADQLNFDGDTQGDACDADDDNDGVVDTSDVYPFNSLRWLIDTNFIYSFNGDSSLDQFGYSVSAAGDVNNDGYDDVIVGAPRDDVSGVDAGSVRVISGANSATLYTFNGAAANDRLGAAVGAAGR